MHSLRFLVHILIMLWLGGPVIAQQASTSYSRVRIPLEREGELKDLAALGLDVFHGDYAPGKFFSTDLSLEEIQIVQEAGFHCEILIEDVVAYYAEQLAMPSLEARNWNCPEQEGPKLYEIPEHFSLGSYGGYYSYSEMLDILDQMHTQYPDLITAKTPIPGITTEGGNPIYWLRISDNAAEDEAEPELLYTALHHAREPGSLSQLIFFMWYVLENYETAPQIQYLLDHTELYFIPCVNPDGYLYNETIAPLGGGLWRKNRRLNPDNTYGVDLNRNYGYEWGFDDSGSSPSPGSSVYRGESPFSEPETQAVRDFCNEHDFQLALNYHTYGNLLILPWSYSNSPTPDSEIFNNLAEALTAENGYLAGTGTETVGYIINGSSDDWMYGEQDSKPSIFSMTPEVGPSSYGFWPPSWYIDDLCQATIGQNLTAGFILHNYGKTLDRNEKVITNQQNHFYYELKQYGQEGGELTVSLEGLSTNIQDTGPANSYTLPTNGSAFDSISFSLHPDIQIGDELVFLLITSNGDISWADTIRKVYRENPIVIFEDAFDNWLQTGNWQLTNETYYSAPDCWTDSPQGNYQSNAENVLLSKFILLPEEVEAASLYFQAKWNIENNYDYVQLTAENIITGTSTPLCGKYSNPGTGPFQPATEPLYDDRQSSWVQEEIDLTPFLGQHIHLQFTLVSDAGVQRDGFYLDDLQVITYSGDTSSVDILEVEREILDWYVFPNPTSNNVHIMVESTMPFSNLQLSIFNNLGQLVEQLPIRQKSQEISVGHLPAGLYYCRLDGRKEGHGMKKLCIK